MTDITSAAITRAAEKKDKWDKWINKDKILIL